MATDVGTLRLYAHFDEGVGPAIVMLHGLNSDGGDWRTVIDTIGPGYRFVAFDLLGFGKSPKPLDIDYSADEHALVIEDTLRDIGVDEPFLLAGYSLGGDIALRYASTYPRRVRRLFLLDAPFYLPASAMAPRDSGLKYAYELMSQRLWGLLAGSKQKDSVLYRLATGVGEAPLKEAFHAEDLTTHWEIMSKNLTNTINASTWVDDLPNLSMPVVHAIGVRDAIVKVGLAPALKRLKPDMEIRRIGGLAADHMTLWNMPERVAEEMMRDEIRELNVAWRGGQGRPLVLLHGIYSASDGWKPAAGILARTHDVAVIDLLGFGDSPAPLSLHYTLSDHVAAVLGTVSALWGPDRAVTFAGDGFGATVALGCTATAPARSAGVVAFSPMLLEPGSSVEAQLSTDERGARVLALQESARKLARDARAGVGASEKAEQRLVPILRTVDNAVLATDPLALLSELRPPVRIVIPSEDRTTPQAFLASTLAGRPGFDIETVDGPRGLPFASPVEAVRGIDPRDAESIELARGARPVSFSPIDAMARRASSGIEATLLRNGLLNLAAAALIALANPTEGVLTIGFALWVVVASISSIVGAFTMRRKTAGTRFTFTTTALPTLLAGLAGLAIASYLLADPENGRRLFAVVVAVYATARGSADLYMALRVRDTSKPRWLLFAGAALGIVTALAILFGPNHGAAVVRFLLALYLALTGMSLLAYVASVRRAAKRRVRDLLDEQRADAAF